MYRHCIYCSGDLGANEAVELFPVGRTLAFDAAKGRLWAVCRKCARWNLAPIEERWEPVEAAERLYHDARLRVQSENVGLAKLPDGTRLIRVGAALQEELAAWRYGDQLVKRRHRHLVVGGVVTIAAVLAVYGAGLATFGAGSILVARKIGLTLWTGYRKSLPLHMLGAHESPNGEPLPLRRRHLNDAVLRPASAGGVELYLPGALMMRSKWEGILIESPVVLPDPVARRVLERGMVHVNAAGAGHDHLISALDIISSAGSAEAYIRRTASKRYVLDSDDDETPKIPEVRALGAGDRAPRRAGAPRHGGRARRAGSRLARRGAHRGHRRPPRAGRGLTPEVAAGRSQPRHPGTKAVSADASSR